MKLYYFSGTHWDREWYRTFQSFRCSLVKVIDELIDGLEQDKGYGVFHLDGQTIVLEDYLKIAGDNRERLKKLIQDGKMMIGPWYCMPDEFLLSGESLIKNLQKGFQIAREYGVEPLKYGYICDIFGHIAQMPQIFQKFGIRHALLGRGTNEHETPAFFQWTAPDGSSVTTFKLHDRDGYGDVSLGVIDVRNEMEPLTEELLRERFRNLIDWEMNRANIPYVLLMDAIDHTNYHKDTPHYLDVIRELYPEHEVYHTSVMEMCDSIDCYLSEEKVLLPERKGELNRTGRCNEGTYIHLISNTLSSYYPLKKMNDRMQTVLEKIVEPFYAYGKINLRKTYLELANRYLMQNHPHDSICGCSIDQVHKDMEYRFDQVKEITDEIISEWKTPYLLCKKEGKQILKIYNPLPYRITKTVTADVYFDPDYKTKYQEPFGYEKINSFRLYDCNGNEIPYGISNIQKNMTVRRVDQKADVFDIYTLTFTCDLSPTGETNLEVRPFAYASRYLDKMRAYPNGGENEFVKFTINQDGTINLTQKESGNCFENLLKIVDDAEIGDGWFHVSPACDISVTNTVATVEKTIHNVSTLQFKITQKLMLPEGIIRDEKGIRRSGNYKEIPVIHYVSLGKNDKYLTVKTLVDNQVKDHRMRLILPTGIQGDTYYVNQPFCFVKRKTDIDITTQDWKECEVLEKQTGGIVYKKNEELGFSFISKYGLHECGVTQNGDIAVTLLRSFSTTVLTNGETRCQLQGELEFEYLLYPADDKTTFAKLQREQDIFATGQLVVNTYAKEVEPPTVGLELTGESLVFSTATADRKLRIYNLSDTASSGNINLSPLKEVDLDGNVLSELPDGTLRLNPWEFKTYSF